jgi:superfamily I DNA and RNA helicase
LHAAADAVPALATSYDAVIVDEAQDFAPDDWDLVKALAGDGALRRYVVSLDRCGFHSPS